MIHSGFFHITRFPSHEVTIGNRPMGGRNPIRLQSMTNTNTLDIEATVKQCIRIIEAGADYVRMSAPNVKAAHALKEISDRIRKAGFTHPLIADIHFNPEVALIAARYVEKVRINPGNYYSVPSASYKIHYTAEENEKEKEVIRQRLKPLTECCQENGTAIRIGTNLGSLSPRIITQYGNTPEGMVNATYEFLEIFNSLGFDNLVISLKASKPLIMVQAYEAMVEKMLAHGMSYPLHIGITEAGEGENGRIKSALGICSLLNKGIGDTLRVSLTEDPEKEIPFALKLSSLHQIPFTQNDSKTPYTITPLQPAKKDIFFRGSKLKAIVIGNYPSKEKASSENACNLLPAGETITPPQTAERKPDLYYCTVKKIVHSHRHENFLANPSVFPEGLPSNVVPLIASTHIEDLKNLAANFFLKASCKDALPDIANIPKQHLQGLIIDTETCLEFDPEPWVAFSQHHEIPLIMRIHFQTSDPDELISHLAIFSGNLLLEKKIHGIWLCAPSAERCIPDVAFGFLQSAGIRITKTEFISCPTCARTSFNLEKVLKEVQTHTSNLPGLKIAVMGCVVNGPGEMADADFGFVGTGAGKLHLYQNGKPVVKNIEPGKAVSALLEILHQNGYINR